MMLLMNQRSMSSLQAADAMTDFLMSSGIDSDGFDSPQQFAQKSYQAHVRRARALGGDARDADGMLQYFMDNTTGRDTGKLIREQELAIPRHDFAEVLKQHLLQQQRMQQTISIPKPSQQLSIPLK